MRLYLLNTADEDQVEANLDDKRERAVESVIDACLVPSLVFSTLEAAQAAGQKIYADLVEEANEDADEHDRFGAYELDWQPNDTGAQWDSVIELKSTLTNFHLRITAVDLVS